MGRRARATGALAALAALAWLCAQRVELEVARVPGDASPCDAEAGFSPFAWRIGGCATARAEGRTDTYGELAAAVPGQAGPGKEGGGGGEEGPVGPELRMAARLERFRSPECQRWRHRRSGLAEEALLGAFGRAKCVDAEHGPTAKTELGSQVSVSVSARLIYATNMKGASLLFKKIMHERFNATSMGTHKLRDFLAELRNREPALGLEDFTVFTFVRDPVSMFYSAYAEVDRRMNSKGTSHHSFQRIARTQAREPERALACLDTVRRGTAMKGMLTPAHMYSQVWKTQRCFYDTAGERVQLGLDFIGKMETLEEDFAMLERVVGVQHKPLFQMHSKHDQYKRHTHALRSRALPALEHEVCRYVEADYDCFGYKMPESCRDASGM